MAPSSIELKVTSCKDLKAFNFFQKLSIYCVVSIVGDDPVKKQKTIRLQQKTPVDRESDGNPEWNHEIRFDLKEISSLNQDDLFLEFRLLCEVIIFADKTIGEVRVPFKGLIEESNGSVRFVSYQVRNTDGNPNGVLSFSYKVIDEKMGIIYPSINSSESQLVYPPMGACLTPPEVCYPPPELLNPSPEVCYPRVEVHDPPSEGGCYQSQSRIHYPTSEICYPPLEIHYQSSESYFMAQSQPSTLPTPAPPLRSDVDAVYPPPSSAFVYPLPSVAAPYGFGSAGNNYPMCGFPTNSICQELHPSNGETWRNSSHRRGRIAGYWDVR